MLMFIPEGWSMKVRAMPDGHRAMYNVLNSIMEAWDGPVGIAGTDGRWVIGGNGPQRSTLECGIPSQKMACFCWAPNLAWSLRTKTMLLKKVALVPAN